MSTLAKIDGAKRMLAEARTFEDVKKVVDLAEAAKKYAQAAKLGREAQNYAGAVALDAKAKAGEMLAQLQKGGGRPEKTPAKPAGVSEYRQVLEAEGVAERTAREWQEIAAQPAKVRETYIEETSKAERGEVTTSGFLKPVRKKAKERKRQERVKDAEASAPEGKYRTIVIDPPWDYNNKSPRVSPDYRGDMMTFEQIENWRGKDGEDMLARWVPEDAGHVYLWATDVYAGDANRLLRKWGYEPTAVLVWVKSKWGLGSYYRHQHELCFFGVKGRLPAKRQDVSTVFEAPWIGNSVKPEKFYEIVESMSPGPRLIVFSRKKREGWSVFGNEVQ